MNKRIIKRVGTLGLAVAMTAAALFQVSDARKSGAAVIKNNGTVTSQSSLSPVKYNGEDMYVARATYYDYYSDAQVGTSATPGARSDGYDKSKNTFSKFNTRLMELMKYDVTSESPTLYPLFQGRQGYGYADMASVYSKTNKFINEGLKFENYTASGELRGFALQGLVDNKLKVDSNGETYITQSNPKNGKSSNLPLFDKKFLTTNKFTNSELALGAVKENVSFPFRREEKDGVVYYEYNCFEDVIRFNANNQLDYLGKNNAEMVKDRLGSGGLFPENKPSDSDTANLNYGYGFKIEVPFNMTSDGKINGKDMVFEFTGDDDVWVFVDGMLALDMGGAHSKVNGSINFATGKTVVDGVKNSNIAFTNGNNNDTGKKFDNTTHVYEKFQDTISDELKNSLKDTTKVHTLTLFYLERGMDVSYMKMKFNLPEPTKLDVANKLDTAKVGATFVEETKKVAKKDSFVYDVVDKTKNTKAVIDMLDGESVTFSNEFNAKDILLIQQKGLKDSNRKMCELYSTSWLLKDTKEEIAKGNDLIVKDSRRTDKTVLFSNKSDDAVPVLDATYTNSVNVGKFVINCSVTDKYKAAHADYNNQEFAYTVLYKNVFGGCSAETVYKGKYIVTGADGKTVEKTTEDGVIKLKAGEKATIVGVPVNTVVSVKANVTEAFIIGKIKTTSQFTYKKETYTATGKINAATNVVEYVVADKSEKEEEKKEDLKKDEIEKIIGEKIPEVKEPEKVESTEDEDALDETAKTADETNLMTWLIILGVSLMLTVISSISIIGAKRR